MIEAVSGQTRNMIMKIVVLGFTFGVIAATLIGAVQARDDGRYTLSPSSHGSTA